MSTSTTSTSTLFAEPIRRVPARWITFFAIAWFGIWMAQLTPIQLLLPGQIATILGFPTDTAGLIARPDWTTPVFAFGVVSAIAGVCALVTFPLVGALSDRTTGRFGRRRPWILAGAVVYALSLFLLGLQENIIGVGVFWSTTLIGFCILTAAITATISDQVPVNQRGFVSAWVSAPQAVGTIAGLLLVTSLALSNLVGYTVMAVVVLVFTAPFLLFIKDARLPRADRPRMSAGALLSGFWVSPLKHPDFGWTMAGRILVNIGNALGTTQLLYFLAFGLRREHVDDDLVELTLVYMVFFVISAIVVGRISDRVGRRKPFVYIASYLQAAAALLLALVQDFSVAHVAAGLLGLGYGSFMAVDQALATQVLPDAHTRGKDLGIMNIATAVPQAIAPLLGAVIIVGFAAIGAQSDQATQVGGFAGATLGFGALFAASAMTALLGGLAVIRIKSVR